MQAELLTEPARHDVVVRAALCADDYTLQGFDRLCKKHGITAANMAGNPLAIAFLRRREEVLAGRWPIHYSLHADDDHRCDCEFCTHEASTYKTASFYCAVSGQYLETEEITEANEIQDEQEAPLLDQSKKKAGAEYAFRKFGGKMGLFVKNGTPINTDERDERG